MSEEENATQKGEIEISTEDKANFGDFPVGVQVWIPDQNIEETIDMVLKMWAAEQPEEVRLYKKYMDNKRSALVNVNGMTKEKHFRLAFEMPCRLNRVFKKVCGPDYMDDEAFMRALKKIGRKFFVGYVPQGGNEG